MANRSGWAIATRSRALIQPYSGVSSAAGAVSMASAAGGREPLAARAAACFSVAPLMKTNSTTMTRNTLNGGACGARLPST